MGLHIVFLSRYAARHDAGGLAFVQLLSMALVFGMLWPLSRPVILPPREVWLALLATGLVASAGVFWYRPSFSSASPQAGRRSYLLWSPSSPSSSDTGLPATGWLRSRWLGALILSALVVGEVVPALIGRNKSYQKGDVS